MSSRRQGIISATKIYARRVKIVHGPLLLMESFLSFWILLNINQVGILSRMVMPRRVIELKPWEILIHTTKVPSNISLRTSFVKRKGVWWLPDMNADMRKEKKSNCSWGRSRDSCANTPSSWTNIPSHSTTAHAWSCWRVAGTSHGPCSWQ